jgi:TolB protein
MQIKKQVSFLIAVVWLGAMQIANAALTIEITQGVDSALPIAVVPFDTAKLSSKLPVDLAAIVASDLNRSGVLKSMERAELPATPHYSNQVQYQRWRNAGQDYLVVGRVLEKSPGVYNIEFQLLDVLKKKQLLGRSMQARKRNLRSRAHQISDFIYEQITGTRGAFNTRIAFIRAQKKDAARNYVLQVADTDGPTVSTHKTSSSRTNRSCRRAGRPTANHWLTCRSRTGARRFISSTWPPRGAARSQASAGSTAPPAGRRTASSWRWCCRRTAVPIFIH